MCIVRTQFVMLMMYQVLLYTPSRLSLRRGLMPAVEGMKMRLPPKLESNCFYKTEYLREYRDYKFKVEHGHEQTLPLVRRYPTGRKRNYGSECLH